MSKLDVFDPATGDLVDSLELSDAQDLVDRSRAAYGPWSRSSAGDRAALLKSGARRLREAADGIALLQTRE